MLRASHAIARRSAVARALAPHALLHHTAAVTSVRAQAACSHTALQSSNRGAGVATACRALSTAAPSAATAAVAKPAKAAGGSGSANPYTHTMLLPRTSFPQHVRSIAEHERDISARFCGPNLYRWQEDARGHYDRAHTFVLHDGPPFANGRLHMGHFMNKVLKDIINRYKLMRGYRIHYVPGWDCHGMPIEVKALELLKAQGGDAAGAGAGADSGATLSASEVRALASRFARAALDEQKRDFSRWGIMGAWDRPYSTMSPAYEAAQLGVFGALVGRGLISRGLKPVYWSPASRTALAEAELEYRDDHPSTSLYLSFPLTTTAGPAREAGITLDAFPGLGVLVWTTTPWTLPANQALAYNPEFEYAVVRVGEKDDQAAAEAQAEAAAALAAAEPAKKGQPRAKDQTAEGTGLTGRYWLLLSSRVPALQALLHRPLVVELTLPGRALEGSLCDHPFLPRVSPLLPGEHVTAEGGSGLVHTAPAHGVEDFVAARAAGITEVLSTVDADGTYTPELGLAVPELRGQNVLKGASKSVVSLVSSRGALVHTSRLLHRYPYDWRSKTPVILRATEQWFCALDAIAPLAQAALDDVQIIPGTGRARLGGMLASRREWCISRQRHWGVPIPVFYHKGSGEALLTSESVAHVQGLVAKHGSDCWWSLPLEELLPPALKGQAHLYERGADTMDVWFDSGCSWRAVIQDPLLGPRFPAAEGQAEPEPTTADMYLEGSDQHRGWFQSSLLTAVSATGRAPYKTILTHGFVLDEQQRKMSKSIGNVLDPNTLINGVGSTSIEDAPAAAPAAAAAAAGAATGAAAGKKAAKGKKVPAAGEPLGSDLLRLWVSSSDYTSDVSVGKAVLSKMAEAMKKIRPSARFMLGNIDDLTPAGVVAYADLPQLDRYTLGLLESHAAAVTAAYESYEFKEVFSLLLSFNATNLSAFVFELAKDRLYAEAPDSASRRAAQTVLLRALVVLTKSLAPIVPHFAEDVYQHVPAQLKQYFHSAAAAAPAAAAPATSATTETGAEAAGAAHDSLFMHGWLEDASSGGWSDPVLAGRVNAARRVRSHVTKLLERVRQEHKSIGNFSEAQVEITLDGDSQLYRDLDSLGNELTALFMTANATLTKGAVTVAVDPAAASTADGPFSLTVSELDSAGTATPLRVSFTPAAGSKCPRCWLFTTEATESEPCCSRCRRVMQQMQAQQ